MSRVFQRAGRSGWYLGVSVPKSLRKKLGKNEVHKKVGNTHAEARINKSRVEAEIQRSFGVELKSLSLVEEVTAMYENDPNYKGLKSIAEIPAKEKEIKSEKEKDINSLLEKYKDIDPELLRKALRGSKK